MFDYYGVNLPQYAQRLHLVEVFKPGNASGFVTDSRLYTPHQNSDGSWLVPPWKGARGIIKHITAGPVGGSSLAHLAGGSIAAGLWTSAHYLIPPDDYTVYKLVPDGAACNHVGPGSWDGQAWLNSCYYGIEVENPANNGATPITPSQYIKAALVTAYLVTRDHINNFDIRDHGLVASPFGRRTDPWAGRWQDSIFWGLLWELRKPQNWPAFWGIPEWDGNG